MLLEGNRLTEEIQSPSCRLLKHVAYGSSLSLRSEKDSIAKKVESDLPPGRSVRNLCNPEGVRHAGVLDNIEVPRVSEQVGVALLLAGMVILFGGLLGLIGLAGRSRGVLFAAFLLLVSPVGPLAYGLIHFHKAKRPLAMVLLGLILGAVPFAWNHLQDSLLGLGERDRIISGERHLVLTGWDRSDYAIFAARTDVVVLELANSDVSDATLELLRPLTRLRELTLNDSTVTDAGLATLKEFSSLESLRVARTKITKDGIVEFLQDPPANLKEIDVSGNSIPASALRKWKNEDPENRRYVN